MARSLQLRVSVLLLCALSHGAALQLAARPLALPRSLRLADQCAPSVRQLRNAAAWPCMVAQEPDTGGAAKLTEAYKGLLSVLAAGDAAALVVFAAIGRGNHASDAGNALTTAAPFLVTWAALAPPLGAYASPARGTRLEAATAPLLAWAAAVPCGCALRGLLQQRMPAAPFWAVALAATAVLLEAWRMMHFQAVTFNDALDRFVDAIVDDDD